LKKGCDEAHVEHWVADGPVHVVQEEWHRWHVSGDVRLPPAQVKPASMAHVWLQPSIVSWLPSSQPSVPTRLPSPQIDLHVSFEARLPPEHAKPVSMVQLALHPSPLMVLLSSHWSAAIQTIRLPSPHSGLHLSSPPTPEPPATSFVEEHEKPSSMRQSASHPSPPAVLLSSQISAVLRMPLPQMCTGATYANDSATDAFGSVEKSSVTVSAFSFMGAKGVEPLAVTTVLTVRIDESCSLRRLLPVLGAMRLPRLSTRSG